MVDEVLDLPAEERRAAVEAACHGDAELEREVASLLAYARDEDDDDTPPIPSAPDSGAPPPRMEGRRIGPYRVERLLGRGGMGAVYLASRVDEFEMRQVALKVLKRGPGAAEMERRFQHERQILAHLDHPNIAKLLDGGTTEDGVPYFVMDYVEGEPIDRYCDRHGLGVRERVELFHKVCSAVHVAHQNLVVHRDLKPANILVGADGEPKLLDFGIAKPLDAGGSPASVLTVSGIQPMTLAFASPEQVAGDAVTTASDVYSLGVVLYELLTGRPPYRPPSSRWLDLANAIQQQQPRRPSTAVTLDRPSLRSGGDPGTETPGSFARRQAAELRGVRRRLAGDLDQIVLTALAKDPERRYPSVEQLSADLRRHLEGRPVAARKFTFAYWAGKFVRRHKIETALAALVLTAILGSAYVAVRYESRLKLEQKLAEEVAVFLVGLFTAPSPDEARGREITARQVLDRGKERIEALRGSQPRLYARLAITIGQVYYQLGLYGDQQALLEDALDDLGRHLDGEADPLLASLNNDLAAALQAQVRLAEAEARYRVALEMKIRLYGDDSKEVVESLYNLATVAKDRGDLEEARRLYVRVLAILKRQSPLLDDQFARFHVLFGTLLIDLDDVAMAENHLRRALAMRREDLESEHTDLAIVLNNLGIALQSQGKAEESEKIYLEALSIRRKRLGDHHHRVAATETNLASLLVSTGRYEEAEQYSRSALSTLRTALPGHWRIAHAESVLGSSLAGLGRFEQAEPLLIETYQILVQEKGECTRYARDALSRLIDLYDVWNRPNSAFGYRTTMRKCEATTPVRSRDASFPPAD